MKREFEFLIDDKFDGKDIKFVLENELKCSSNIITRLKKGEYILLNGKRETVIKKLAYGDRLKIIIPEESPKELIKNPQITFDVIFEDEDILVVNKPAKIPTHPSQNHYTDTLANGIAAYIDSGEFVFRAVNRLDRETSGIVLIAKNILAAHLLSAEATARKIKKIYYAICENEVNPPSGLIDAPIAREKESIIKRCVRSDGRAALTKYETVKVICGKSLVKVNPLTGRTHQIRVHFAYIGSPLLGDALYGHDIGERTRLHCKEMSFTHPILKKHMTVECPLPPDFSLS